MDDNSLRKLITDFPDHIDKVTSQIIATNLNKGLKRLNFAIVKLEQGSSVSYNCSPSLSIATNRERWKLGLPKGGVLNINSTRPIVFPELRPNTCGILTCEVDSELSTSSLLEKINNSKNLFHRGVWDFGKDNHFVSLFQARSNNKKYALVHGSEQSIKVDSNIQPGLYIESSTFWRKKSVDIVTPYGNVKCLLDDDALLYWETYLAAELKSKQARLSTAVDIFGNVTVISDFVHVGMHQINAINLGVNIASTTGLRFPLLSSFGESIFFVSTKNKSSELKLVPHSFGSDLKGFRSIKSIAHDDRGDLYELEHENGMSSIVRDFSELPFESRLRNSLNGKGGFYFDETLRIEETLTPLLSIKL